MKPDDLLSKQEQLERAISAQENLRGVIDDAVIEVAVAALQKQLAELNQKLDPQQQRKLASVLFMDVVGSTILLHELDPEENMAIMDSVLQRLAAPVESHGGRIHRFMGDGFLAVFGLPSARENDPEMAVQAGLDILELAGHIAQELDSEWNIKGFQVRVGMNTGLIVAGGISEAESTIMGTAVNLAARMESSAPPGGFLISQYTYEHVRGIFDLEPVGEIQVKGFPEPVKAYLVKKVKPHKFHLRTRGVEGVETHMVGRDEELSSLQKYFDFVIQSHNCCFVTVVGEAGLGKSRLLYEFESWLDLQSLSRLLFKGRATIDTLSMPYGLLRDLLAPHFGIMDNDSVSVLRNKIVAEFRQALEKDKNPEMKAHFVGQMLGYDFRDSRYLHGVLESPKQLYDRAVVYLAEFFKAMALVDPVVIFLDDIHWADDTSLDILYRLRQELAECRVFIVALARPSLFERRSSWEDDPFYVRLDLHPLSSIDSQRLIGEVLKKVKDIPDELSDLIVHNSEGNPYYLEELIKMLVEDGVIVKGESAWRIHVDKLVDVRVPPTLTGVIQARLDSLPTNERTILQQSSVVGRVFWDSAVLYVSNGAQPDSADYVVDLKDIEQILDILQHREMVFQHFDSVFKGTSEYSFKHTILRDVTYESVLKRTRRIYHAIVADWLIAHSGEREGEFTGLIALHLEKAEKKELAIEYLRRAGEAAISNFALNEAAEFYSRALALTSEDDLQGRYTFLLGKETVFGLQGNRVAQHEMLEALSDIAERMDEDHKRAEVLIRRAWYLYWVSENPKAYIVALQAVTLADAIEAKDLSGSAYWALSWSCLQTGEYDQALEHSQHALELARKSGDRRIEGNLLNILGMTHIAQGDYFGAQGYLEQFLTIAHEIGDRDRESTALNNLGVVLTTLGNYQSAQEYLHQTLKITLEAGDRVSESTALINLAWVTSASGDWEKAIEYAEAGIEMKKEFGHVESLSEGLVWLGHALLGNGQPDKAMDAYQRALKIRRDLNLPHQVMEVLSGIARVYLAKNDVQRAHHQVEEIIAYIRSGGTLEGTWEPFRIYLTCYHVLKLVEDPHADEILEVACKYLHDQASRIPDESARKRFLTNVPWHREIETEWRALHALE